MPGTMLNAVSKLSHLIFTKIHDVVITGDKEAEVSKYRQTHGLEASS